MGASCSVQLQSNHAENDGPRLSKGPGHAGRFPELNVNTEEDDGQPSNDASAGRWLAEDDFDEPRESDLADAEANLDEIEWQALTHFRELPAADQHRYLQLSAYPPDQPIPLKSILTLWRYGGMTSKDGFALLERLAGVQLVLAESSSTYFVPAKLLLLMFPFRASLRSSPSSQTASLPRSASCPDVAYLSADGPANARTRAPVDEEAQERRKARAVRRQHRHLLRAYRATLHMGEYRGQEIPWHTLADDGYVLSHLVLHTVMACEFDLLMSLFFDMRWLAVRLRHDGPQSLLADIDLYLAATENLVTPSWTPSSPTAVSTAAPSRAESADSSLMSPSSTSLHNSLISFTAFSDDDAKGSRTSHLTLGETARTPSSVPPSPFFPSISRTQSQEADSPLASPTSSSAPCSPQRASGSEIIPLSVRCSLHGKARSRKTLRRVDSRNHGYVVQNECILLLKHALMLCAPELTNDPAQLPLQLMRRLKNYAGEHPQIARLLDRSQWSPSLRNDYRRTKPSEADEQLELMPPTPPLPAPSAEPYEPALMMRSPRTRMRSRGRRSLGLPCGTSPLRRSRTAATPSRTPASSGPTAVPVQPRTRTLLRESFLPRIDSVSLKESAL